ncbi:MAG TPA: C4-type zinc ribbon domain-containing protein [Bacteroidota bacterium]|nr:C4-type zinc ribbon domain-containing protein [Bacteroidota bacterium]
MKERTVEKELKYLYALQQVDTQLQEVLDLKGDLPSIVEELQGRVSELKSKLKGLNDALKQAKIDRDDADVGILECGEKIDKYKGQQLHVKSNKQYDALTKEIEAAEAKSLKLEKEMEMLEGRMQQLKGDIETTMPQLEELSAELEGKQKELREVNKEHEKEELKLKHEREKLVVRVDPEDLERYERIRKAKGGTAVVPVKRGACGGCFNRVPPQKILEIRQNLKLYQCEHCGRILVSDHIVEMSLSPT